jgi:hypothetical protein
MKIRCYHWMGLVAFLFVPLANAADWWTYHPLAMPARPEAAGKPLQNPPLFSWPLRYATPGYELQLNGAGGVTTYRSTQNWLHLKTTLPAGNYSWKVRALDAAGAPTTRWCDERDFQIDAGLDQFVTPDPGSLWTKALQTPHPRGLPHGDELRQLKTEFAANRAVDLAGLKGRLEKKLGAGLLTEPARAFNELDAGAAKTQAMGDLRNTLYGEQETVVGLGLLWHVERDRTWLDEGRRRALALARWDPEGSSGLVSHNQATRTILFTLASALDSFYDELSASDRQVLISNITKRYAALHATIVGNASLAQNPHNPWASYTLGYLVAVAPLIAGDVPEASSWFASSFDLYTAIFPPWSGDDGGHANGTAYGVWSVPESIFLWDALRWSTGFDFYRKPAVKNFGQFMAYFLPPGAPEGVFGDGAEVRMASSIARYGKAFAARAPTPLMDWYARQLFGEDRAAISMLTAAPQTSAATTFPVNTPDSAYFPSVGWAAMHSSLADRSRLSVYFKSSPYGSFNHSHADQNSFVIHARGRVIAMDSGVYDYYNSPHWREWYKQTRAHNAVTYDGGRGQGLGEEGTGSKALNGRIDKFVSTPEYDLVVGDATVAYQGELTKAKRWVALLRPNMVVVVDQLAAATPRRWEWNYHTTTKPVQTGSYITNVDDGVAFCTRVSAPESLDYQMVEGYNPPPQSTVARLEHFGSRFSYRAPTSEGLFVSVISMDCNAPPPAVSWVGNKAMVTVENHVVTFSGTDLSIQ